MAQTSLILDRQIVHKFTLNAALDELSWIDSQLRHFDTNSIIRSELIKYRDFVESHTESPN